jgi:hypothetical protein
MTVSVTREQVLGFRVRAQQLDRDHGDVTDTAVLDIGVQDTGPDGGLWALAIRGVDVARLAGDELTTVWSIRGAPHLYRRADLASVAAAVQPFSSADAASRVFDAAKPLRAAGVDVLDALDTVAAAMRSVVDRPTVKGEVSARLRSLLDEAYLRYCRSCDAIHPYEMPFRLAALRAGLELQAGTSPPVLQRVPGLEPLTGVPEGYDDQHDVIRDYLRLLGPATQKQVAGYLDAPVKEVDSRWPEDVVEVTVEGETRWALAEDADRLGDGPPRVTRLLGPYDLFLQAKDRRLLVDDPARSRELWPVLGRPGVVLQDGEVVGSWRPRKSASRLDLQVTLWTDGDGRRGELGEQAERLAAFRGVRLGSVDYS